MENIYNIKNVIYFLCRIISYKEEIGDQNLSIILRLFFKHHFTTVIEMNLKLLLIDEFDKFPITQNIIMDFYRLIDRKIILLNN